MNKIDWMGTPLGDFLSRSQVRADGTAFIEILPLGDGEAQRLVGGLAAYVEDAYARVLPEEEWESFETRGEVPLIRDGQRNREALNRFTLRDLPAILDTIVVLEEDHQRRVREEAERKAAERKRRERVRAKERRKLKKLGEW